MRSRSRGPDMSPAERVAAMMASFVGPAKQWLVPSDMSSLFQDSAGATPVTASGQPVGRILDRSGAGNHMAQVTAPSRPVWQSNALQFDGIDDILLSVANVDMRGASQVTVVMGLRKLSDVGGSSGVSFVLEHSEYVTNPGFVLFAPLGGAADGFGAGVNSGSGNAAVSVGAGYAAPVSAVLTGLFDTSAVALEKVRVRTNGLLSPNRDSAGGTSAFQNATLGLGNRPTPAVYWFNGAIYGLIIIGRTLSPDELWVCEQYMAQQVGIAI